MKFLFVAPSWVGDMVMAQSLFKKCRKEYPDAVMDVVAPQWSLPLISRMPEIRNGIPLPVGHGKFGLLTRISIGRALVEERYDRAIILPRTWKSALVPFFAKISRRIGFLGELRYGLVNDLRIMDKNVLTMTVLRYLALAEEKNEQFPPKIEFLPQLEIDQDNCMQLIHTLDLSMNRPVICFCPGAEYGPAKQWPINYYRILAEMLLVDGFQVWTLGSAKEAGTGDRISPGNSKWYKNLCGKTRLEDTVDLMSLAACAVTNDSGLMHVAAASGVVVQAIYGSSSPSYTPPLTHKADIHYLGIDCSPCFERQCPLGHLKCLKEIAPDTLYQSIRNQL